MVGAAPVGYGGSFLLLGQLGLQVGLVCLCSAVHRKRQLGLVKRHTSVPWRLRITWGRGFLNSCLPTGWGHGVIHCSSPQVQRTDSLSSLSICGPYFIYLVWALSATITASKPRSNTKMVSHRKVEFGFVRRDLIFFNLGVI